VRAWRFRVERGEGFGGEEFVHECLEALSVFDSLFDGLDLVQRDIDGVVFSVFPLLEVVVRAFYAVFIGFLMREGEGSLDDVADGVDVREDLPAAS